MGSREMLKVPNPLWVVTIPLLLGSLVSPALAQSPTYGVGRTPTAEELRRMDISIGPTGEELPPGSRTAKEGAQVYVQKACIGCHGVGGIGGAAPALRSEQGADVAVWQKERILPLRLAVCDDRVGFHQSRHAARAGGNSESE